jgi:hypothetical protein
MEITLHRFVLAEFNTHRAIARNSASSRAIPVAKRIAMVREACAFPYEWGENQKGMQAETVLQDHEAEEAKRIWQEAALDACRHAERLLAMNVHKQVVNRLLEPFVFTTVLASATEWENFFSQRCSKLAAPEMMLPAVAAFEAMHGSTPVPLRRGEWHLPYISAEERAVLTLTDQRRVSVARCARVSTLTQDGVRDTAVDLGLYERLVSARPMHASPLEHVATPHPYGSGNFTGWLQFRHVVEYAAEMGPGR